MANLGILTPAQESKLSEMLDTAVKLKGLAEFLDGYIFKAVITFIDDKYANLLKEDAKVKLGALVDAVIAEDIPLAESLTAEVLNSLVDIPGLDEEDEGLLFKGVLELIVGVIMKWIADKKAADEATAKAAQVARVNAKAKTTNPVNQATRQVQATRR